MDWEALASAVVARRVQLGHETRKEFIDASGLSPRTMGDIETARRESYSPSTLARLEQALDWPAGRVAEILGSDVPALIPADAVALPADLVEAARLLAPDSLLAPSERAALLDTIRLVTAPYTRLAEMRAQGWPDHTYVPGEGDPPVAAVVQRGRGGT